MAMARVSRLASICTVCLLLSASAVQAVTTGRAEVGVTRFLGQPFSTTIPVPQNATDFTTFPAEISAVLQPTQDARVHARAVAGLDIPDGTLVGNIATFARIEVLGGSVRAFAGSHIEFEEVFELRSDTLPAGTLVDVVISPMLVHMGGASSTGFGPCCSIRSVYEFHINGNIAPYDSSYRALTAGFRGVLGGNGHDMDDIQFNQPFGPFAAEGIVGQDFYFRIAFETESEALASAVFETGFGVHAGQSDATATALMLFATEVFPAAVGLAAADALSFDAASGGSEGYLLHPASGLRLPGIEALDPANVQAHLLPLSLVPEPTTFLLMLIALGGLSLKRYLTKATTTPELVMSKIPVEALTQLPNSDS